MIVIKPAGAAKAIDAHWTKAIGCHTDMQKSLSKHHTNDITAVDLEINPGD